MTIPRDLAARPAGGAFDPVAFECPRCGFNLWRVLRKRALRNVVEHLACLGIGFSIGLPLSFHHLVTLIRFLLRA